MGDQGGLVVGRASCCGVCRTAGPGGHRQMDNRNMGRRPTRCKPGRPRPHYRRVTLSSCRRTAVPSYRPYRPTAMRGTWRDPGV